MRNYCHNYIVSAGRRRESEYQIQYAEFISAELGVQGLTCHYAA